MMYRCLKPILPRGVTRHILLSMCLSSMISVSASHAETLQDAVKKAVLNHPAVERAAIAADIAKQDMREQRSGFFPTLSASLGGGRLYGDNATSRGLNVTRGAGYSWLWEGNAALNQMIFDWNQTSNRVDSAIAERKGAVHTFEDVKQSIAIQTVQNYLALHRAQVLYDEAQNHMRAMEDYRGRIEKLVEGGGADEAEASRARDLVLVAQNAVVNLKGQLAAAKANYIEVVGTAPETTLSRPSLPLMLDEDLKIDEIVKRIQAHHPQILALHQQMEAQDYTIRAEEKEVLPKVGSEFSYTKKDQKDVIGGESVDARAMLRLNWSMDTGGAQFARAQKAKLQKDQNRTQVEELRRSLERNLRIALASLEVAREQRDIQQGRYDELTQTLATYKQQFEATKRSLLEVAQTESQVFTAYNDFLAAEYGVLDAAYGFLASQGRLIDAIEILEMMNQEDDVHQSDDQDMLLSALEPYPISAGGRTKHDHSMAVFTVEKERAPLSKSASVSNSDAQEDVVLSEDMSEGDPEVNRTEAYQDTVAHQDSAIEQDLKSRLIAKHRAQLREDVAEPAVTNAQMEPVLVGDPAVERAVDEPPMSDAQDGASFQE